MAITSQASLLMGAAAAGGDPYIINYSCRFDADHAKNMHRAVSSTGNRQKWTASFWLKGGWADDGYGIAVIAANGAHDYLQIHGTGAEGVPGKWYSNMRWDGGGTSNHFINWDHMAQSGGAHSCWNHFTWVYDAQNGDSALRHRLFMNGRLLETPSTPHQNDTFFNTSGTNMNLGFNGLGDNGTFFMADMIWCYGQAYLPTKFAEVYNGAWYPKDPEKMGLTYGTNGFWLKFEPGGIGTDSSGNGNNFTVNNISSSAGVENDITRATPTDGPTDDDDLSGGQTTGNANMWNPHTSSTVDPTNGMKEVTVATWSGGGQHDTQGSEWCIPNSGKWYFEYTKIGGSETGQGVAGGTGSGDCNYGYFIIGGSPPGMRIYHGNGWSYGDSGAGEAGPGALSDGDVVGCAVNMDAATPTLQWYKNGSVGNQFNLTGADHFYLWASGTNSGASAVHMNCGERDFSISACPTGYKPLMSQFIKDVEPVNNISGEALNIQPYTGNGSTQSVNVGWKPRVAWFKSRGEDQNWKFVYDDSGSGMGDEKELGMNNAAAVASNANGVTSFTSTGVNLGSSAGYNANTLNYHIYPWRMDTAWASSDGGVTAGTVATSGYINAAAGMSVFTYTGNATDGATLGHNLGAIPKFWMVKAIDGTTDWQIYHHADGGGNNDNSSWTSTAAFAQQTMWNNTSPTSTLITVSADNSVNQSGKKYICQAFAEVQGFSKFGMFTGNGLATMFAPNIYCGFRPQLVICRLFDAAGNWNIFHDEQPELGDPHYELIRSNNTGSSASYSGTYGISMYFRPNGFQIHTGSASNDINDTGLNTIFMAWGRHGMHNCRAAPSTYM